jgi:UDP-MurNAc hydroxylase
MRITSVGHAGLLIETGQGRILCDPWFNPAYFASWFPYPDNSWIDPATLADAEYLYISHLHRDHCDSRWLRRHMSKDTCVLLPDYPVPELRHELRELGFRNLLPVRRAEPTALADGLSVLIDTVRSPSDGPDGDSVLAVDDGGVRVLNQNDARPVAEGPLREFGPFDAHFLQYSGAIWYPMVYDFPQRMKDTLGRRKRRNGMARALRYIEMFGARHVFPFAGPPCFLDDDLFHLNDLDSSETNVFPDQFAFLDYLREHGRDRDAHLLLPGTTVTLAPGGACRVEQPSAEAVAPIRPGADRRRYLEAYRERMRPVIEAERRQWPTGHSDLAAELADWIDPLLEQADHLCAGVNGRILLTVEEPAGEPSRIVFDFLQRRVVPWDAAAQCRYTFTVARPLIEHCVRRREPDWVNGLFLSCRFSASRRGPYNEYVYAFFTSLSAERMAHTESYYAAAGQDGGLARAGGLLVQRHCPHLRADLVRFGTVQDGVVTCHVHGWRFDLATGRCLTSDDRRLLTREAAGAENPENLPEIPAPPAAAGTVDGGQVSYAIGSGP